MNLSLSSENHVLLEIMLVDGIEDIEKNRISKMAQLSRLTAPIPSGKAITILNKKIKDGIFRNVSKSPGASLLQSDLRSILNDKTMSDLDMFKSRYLMKSPSPQRNQSDDFDRENLIEKRLEALAEKNKRISGAFRKFKALNPPNSYECQLQSQILELEVKNIDSLLNACLKDRSIRSKSPTLSISKSQTKHILGVSNSRQNDLKPEAQKQITQLLKERLKLEKKCDDRKASIKKLYYIVIEKEKQLKKAFDGIQLMKDAMESLRDTAESEMVDKVRLLDSFEKRLQRSNDQLIQLSEMLFAANIKPDRENATNPEHMSIRDMLTHGKENPYLMKSDPTEPDQIRQGHNDFEDEHHLPGSPSRRLFDGSDMSQRPSIVSAKAIVSSRFELAGLFADLQEALNVESPDPRAILESCVLALDDANRQAMPSKLAGTSGESFYPADKAYESTMNEINKLKAEKAKEISKLNTHVHDANKKLFDKEKECLHREQQLRSTIVDLESKVHDMSGKIVKYNPAENECKMCRSNKQAADGLTAKLLQADDHLKFVLKEKEKEIDSVRKAISQDNDRMKKKISKLEGTEKNLLMKISQFEANNELVTEDLKFRVAGKAEEELNKVRSELLTQLAANNTSQTKLLEVQSREQSLKNQLNRVQKDLSTAKNERDDLNNQLAEANDKIDQLQYDLINQPANDTSAIVNYANQLNRVGEVLQAIEGSKTDLDKSIIEAKQYVAYSIVEIEAWIKTSVTERVKTVIKEKNDDIEKAQVKLMAKAREVSELQASLDAERKIQSLNLSKNKSSEQNSRLQKELDAKRTQVEGLTSTVRDLEAALNRQRSEMEKKDGIIQHLRQSSSQDLLAKERAIQEAYSKIATHIEENQKNSELYNEQLRNVEANSKIIADDLKKIIDENNSLCTEIESKDALLSKKDAEVNSLKAKLDNLQRSGSRDSDFDEIYSKLRDENKELHISNKELLAQLGTTQEKFQSLKDNYLKVEAEKSDLRRQCMDSYDANKELQMDLVQRRALDEERVKVLKDYKRREEIYKQDLNQLAQKVKDREAEIETLKEKNLTYIEQSKSEERRNKISEKNLQDHIDQVETRLKEDHRLQIADFESRLQAAALEHRSEIDRLSQKLSDCKSTIDSMADKLTSKDQAMVAERGQSQAEIRLLTSQVNSLTVQLTAKDAVLGKTDRGGRESADCIGVYGERMETYQDEDDGEKGEHEEFPVREMRTEDEIKIIYSRMLVERLALKYEIKVLHTRIVALQLKWSKAQPTVIKFNSMKSENTRLNEKIMDFSKKLLNAEATKDKMVEQLVLRENQLEDVINSRNYRSEIIERESQPTKTKGKSHERFSQLTHQITITLSMLKNYYKFSMPPLDDPNHNDWPIFIRNLKELVRKDKIEVSSLKESVEEYKSLLDSKCTEVMILQDQIQSRLIMTRQSSSFRQEQRHIRHIR